jgi:hypothetical protein
MNFVSIGIFWNCYCRFSLSLLRNINYPIPSPNKIAFSYINLQKLKKKKIIKFFIFKKKTI